MGLSGVLRTEKSYLLTFGCFTSFFLQLVIRRSRCLCSLSESALAGNKASQIYSKKKKWRKQEQREQQEVDEQLAARGVWNTNYSSVHPVKQQVLDVLRDQAKRGQVLVLSQQVAKKRFPGLVVASMGAVKKEKDGVISARVVFDGTNGSYVNNSTHLRDQERSPVAGDIKRFMREKARVGEPTFGLC